MMASSFQRWQDLLQPPALQAVTHPLLDDKQVELRLLRADAVHPVISGNKAYKLKYNLEAALNEGAAAVLSFGGVWSNHLHALAYSCYLLQLPCIAVIRGEAELIPKSAMLQDLQRWGCQLHFVPRKEYRLRDGPDWLATLRQQFPDSYIIPEGGSSALANPGLAELALQLESACQNDHWQPDQVWCAVGTAGTLAGLINGRKSDYQLVGVPVLKGADFLIQDIRHKLTQPGDQHQGLPEKCQLLLDGHWGGYGKAPPELLQEMQVLSASLQSIDESSVPELDPIYTGKLVSRLWHALQKNDIPGGSRIVLIHTGGLQGRRGYGLDWHDGRSLAEDVLA